MSGNYCSNCGSLLEQGQKFCDRCGSPVNIAPSQPPHQPQSQSTYQQQPAYAQPNIYVNVQTPAHTQPIPNARQVSPHSQGIVLLIWFFFGIVGGHHFLVGRMGMGLLYLFTGGLFGIGWFIDLCSILGGTFTDAYGRPVVA